MCLDKAQVMHRDPSMDRRTYLSISVYVRTPSDTPVITKGRHVR